MLRFLLLALMALSSPAWSQAPADKLSTKSEKTLSELVQDLDQLYAKAADEIFGVEAPEVLDEIQGRVAVKWGTVFGDLIKGYDARVAGRCTKVLVAQGLNLYVRVLHAMAEELRKQGVSITQSNYNAAALDGDYHGLLLRHGISAEDLEHLGRCSAFEYDLEPLYESIITVSDPGFWDKKRQAKTFIRLIVKNQKGDGTVDLEAWVGAGKAKGRYTGVGKRSLTAQQLLEVSLMREKEALLISGSLLLIGQDYADPITGQKMPKLPPRTLYGKLTIHDGDDALPRDPIVFHARESDATIGAALGGFKVPADAAYGSYLNVVLATFRGKGIGRNHVKFASLLGEIYMAVQRDNPIMGFHPVKNPVFMTEDEVSFLLTDLASDVQALAVQKLRAPEFAARAKTLGAQSVTVAPFYRIKKGTISLRMAGRTSSEVKFEGLEDFLKKMVTAEAAVDQETAAVFMKFGLFSIFEEAEAATKGVPEFFELTGKSVEALLEGVPLDQELAEKLKNAREDMLQDSKRLLEHLENIVQTRDTAKVALLVDAFSRKAMAAREMIPGSAETEIAKKLDAELGKLRDTFARLENNISAAGPKRIDAALKYASQFGLKIEIEGDYVNTKGQVVPWTWKWSREIPRDLETFITGVKNEKN